MPAKNTDGLNLHQKILKIADMAGALKKNKKGFNYNYVTEDEIQAKITAGMQKYNVMLYTSLVPGTLNVIEHNYTKIKSKQSKDEKGKTIMVDMENPVHEIIVSSEVKYTWVNTDNPEDKIECYWAYVGQMEDASQAFGAGATYGNRYYLLKALQLATTDDDPDNYRSKQKEAEQYEEIQAEKAIKEELKKLVEEITTQGAVLIQNGLKKERIMEVVGNHNNGNGNPKSIKSRDVAQAIIEELKNIEEKEINKK